MNDKVINDAMVSIENRVRHVYNQGFEEGIADGNISSGIFADKVREAYNNGLEDAWECARKIYNMDVETTVEVFCNGLPLDNFTASEAIEKLKEYEEKQTEEKTDKINLCADCETCRFADLTAYEFPCSVCSASHTFRWEARKGAEE